MPDQEKPTKPATDKKSLWLRFLKVAGPAAPVVVALVLFTIGVGGGNAVTYSSTPEFCNSCHSMSPEYESWKVSPHAPDVACIECHSDPGAFGELAAHIKGARFVYKTIAGLTPKVIMSKEIPNASCLKCHVMTDDMAKGVNVQHQMHLDDGVSCQDCHAGLVHKANEQKTGDVRFHNLCETCHEQKKVVLKSTGSTSCTACHTDLSKQKPANHSTNWMATHGKSAVADPTCGQCHLAPTAGAHGPMSQPVDYKSSSTGDDCATCHQTSMPHAPLYLTKHGADAQSLGAQVCNKCHSPSTPASPAPDHASAKFCSSCHSGVTMPHGKGWLAQHGPAAGTATNPVCLTCHSQSNRVNPTAPYAQNDFCTKCHAGLTMPHPSNWQDIHGQQALKSGISCLVCHSSLNPVAPNAPSSSTAYCAACHDGSKHPANWVAQHSSKANQSCYICHSEEKNGKNSCQVCHNGKPSEKQLFHLDQYWWVNHSKAAQAQGEASCQKCHSYIQPACSKCHSNR